MASVDLRPADLMLTPEAVSSGLGVGEEGRSEKARLVPEEFALDSGR